jgi:hypothetical protein
VTGCAVFKYEDCWFLFRHFKNKLRKNRRMGGNAGLLYKILIRCYQLFQIPIYILSQERNSWFSDNIFNQMPRYFLPDTPLFHYNTLTDYVFCIFQNPILENLRKSALIKPTLCLRLTL